MPTCLRVSFLSTETLPNIGNFNIFAEIYVSIQIVSVNFIAIVCWTNISINKDFIRKYEDIISDEESPLTTAAHHSEKMKKSLNDYM